MARIRLHGFSDREISQARASMMSDVESAYIERDQDYSQVGGPLLAASDHASGHAVAAFGQYGQRCPWQVGKGIWAPAAI